MYEHYSSESVEDSFVDPELRDIVYWRDVRMSGAALSACLALLISLTVFNALAVFGYLSLAILVASMSFAAYKYVLNAVQKDGAGDAAKYKHAFEEWQKLDLTIDPQTIQRAAAHLADHLNCAIKALQRAFLIVNVWDSVRFGVLLWLVATVGRWMDGYVLAFLSVTLAFSWPKLYESHRAAIDDAFGAAKAKLDALLSKLPGVKPKRS